MAKIGILGERESIAVFHALGMDIFCVRTEQEACSAFGKMLDLDYAVIYLEEKWLAPLRMQVDACAARELPAVVLLPSKRDKASAALAALDEAVKRAVGADIA